MKIKNLRLYRGDLVTLRDEYTQMGFDTSLDNGVLTVYAIRRKKAKKDEKRGKR